MEKKYIDDYVDDDVLTIKYKGKDRPVKEIIDMYESEILAIEISSFVDEADRQLEYKRIRKKYRQIGLNV